jgi:hypothetical protein
LIGRALKRKDAIAIDAGITDEQFVELFAAHAFHWVTPETFDGGNAHTESKSEESKFRKMILRRNRRPRLTTEKNL